MEWGVWYSKLKAAGKEGKHSPPDLYEDLMHIWQGFLALSNSRIGFESIRFSEIESYLNLNGIYSLDQRQEIAHLIRIMDEKYLEFMNNKHSAEITRNKRN